MIQIRNMLNYDYTQQKKQRSGGVSLSVPDQAMSVREILTRYARGLPLGGQKAELWDGEEEYIPDPKTLDLSEMEDLKNEATELFTKVKNDKSAKAKKAEERKIRDQIKKELEQSQSPNIERSENPSKPLTRQGPDPASRGLGDGTNPNNPNPVW